MNAASISLPSGPTSGLVASSFLAIPVQLSFTSAATMKMSKLFLWLNRNTAGRRAVRFSSPSDVQPNAVQREHRLRPGPGQEVQADPLVPGQQAQAQRARRHRAERADRGQVADPAERPAAAPAAEPQDGPAAPLGDRRQPRPGVDRPRVADQVHQREVLVAVRVEVARPHVDPVLGGELLHAGGLAGAPDHRALDLAGQHAVVVDHEPVAHHVVDAEVAGHRLGLHGQRRGAQHHGVAAALVGADQVAHLRVDQVHHGLLEDPLADLLHVLGQPPPGRADRARDHVLELAPAQPVLHRELHHLQELGRPDLAAAQPVPGDGRDGEPGHQRPVQVEEGAGSRPLRARVHVGHRPRQPQRPMRRRHEVRSPPPAAFGPLRFLTTERVAARPTSTISSNPAWRHFSSWSAAANEAVS